MAQPCIHELLMDLVSKNYIKTLQMIADMLEVSYDPDEDGPSKMVEKFRVAIEKLKKQDQPSAPPAPPKKDDELEKKLAEMVRFYASLI